MRKKGTYTLERKANLIAHGIIEMLLAVIFLAFCLICRFAVFKSKLLVFWTNKGILNMDWVLYVFGILYLSAGLGNLLSAVLKPVETVIRPEKVLEEGVLKKTIRNSCVAVGCLLVLLPLIALIVNEGSKDGNLTLGVVGLGLFIIFFCLSSGIKAILNCVFEKCLEERLLLEIAKERKEKEQAEKEKAEKQAQE